MPSGHEIRLLKLLCFEYSLCDGPCLKRLFSFVDKTVHVLHGLVCKGITAFQHLSLFMEHGAGIEELDDFFLKFL